MNELEITWGRSLKVWWSMVWRLVIFGAVAGLIVGIIVGIVGAIIGIDQGVAQLISGLGGALISLPIGVWVVKIILGKNFSDFRIALLSIE